ncbi:MAG: ornithine cyclodeaminase family protein [Alphaproteobacteria bacterium]|nr:ornithine cyclodeaminase family protein [Alphaproteobacteria bacterium]
MRSVTATELAAVLDDVSLVDALGAAFREAAAAPVRAHHAIPASQAAPQGGTLLLMPAWTAGGPIGVKIVSVFADNASRGLPSVTGVYLLLDGATGVPLALMDGPRLTALRTAAASALAARFLARDDARHLVMVGTGALAPHLIRAHAAVRPIRRVSLWGRSHEKAALLAAELSRPELPVAAVPDLAAAVAEADIVSCATLARAPLIQGAWLRPGCHLDLVGGFTSEMREADDTAVIRARLFVDTRAGALGEAGDIVDPLRRGIIDAGRIEADLHDLAMGRHPGREHPGDITLFKSVGTAIEDLAAARLAATRLAIL